jgi:hypothetical protein
MRTLTALAALTIVAAAPAAMSQTPPPPPPLVQTQDAATPEAIVHSMYDVISGPAGSRNWDRMRALMAPNARFVAASIAKDGSIKTYNMGADDYVAHATPAFAKDGFYERGVVLRVTRYGHTAVVESPYESHHAVGDAPFARGINQFVLINDGTRWWVTEIIWEGESADNPLPPEADAALKAR